MHGTFRSQVEGGATIIVRFDPNLVSAAAPGKGRAKWAALLAGCCVAALPHALDTDASEPPVRILPPAALQMEPATSASIAERHPTKPASREPHKPAIPRTQQTVPEALTPQVLVPAPAGIALAGQETGQTLSPPSVAIADATSGQVSRAAASSAIPLLKESLPAPAETVDQTETPAPKLAAVKLPDTVTPVLIEIDRPDSAAPALAAAESAPTATPDTYQAEALRPVDIAQISDSDVRSLRVPQMHEPGLAADGEPTLAAKIGDMQVTPLPPVRLRDSDRALLLAEAPTQMTVRVGNSALGKVDFHMTDTRTIDVRLSGLLDLLADHYDAAEFARLRGSAAADSFVSFDQLRALGLNLRYDPVYDELRING